MFDQSHREAVSRYEVDRIDYEASPRDGYSFEEWHGSEPDPSAYRPDWPESALTHLQMYETCTGGTPISPVFKTPEEVARWCADNGASAFGYTTASYEAWLRVARGGYACSAVIVNGGPMVSGVEGL